MKTSSATSQALVLAVTISLFTQLRFSFLGVGELLILLVFLASLKRPIKRDQLKRFIFTKFWLTYICLSLVGGATNIFVLEHPTSTPSQMLFDLGAYVFVLITCFTFEKLYYENALDLRKFLVDLFYGSSIVLTALFILSFFVPSFLGFTLTYWVHFAPLVDNVHQTSMYLVVLPFLGIIAFSSSRGVLARATSVLLISASVAMSLSAVTTKAGMALVVAAIVLVYAYSTRGVNKRLSVPINALYAIAVVGTFFWLDVGSMAQNFFMEADIQGARESLYTRALEDFKGSPLVGHGPGQHVLQTGLVGFVLYFLFTVKVVSRIWSNPPLLAAFSAIFVYSAGGDILRRLPIWVVLLLIYYWPAPACSQRYRGARVDGTPRSYDN